MRFLTTPFGALALLSFIGSTGATAQQPIEPLMASIPGGSFEMGSDSARHTQPVHTVTLKPFSIGKFEVTVREFRQFTEATGYAMPQECRHELDDWMLPTSPGSWDNNYPTTNEFQPVVCIGWKAADAYAKWLAAETGRPYRLPSEAEWEYAALAGARTKFHFGDDPDGTEICSYANTADLAGENILQRSSNTSYVNFAGGLNNCVDHAGYASIVGMYKPNRFGLYNVIGNVFEFVADCFHPDYEHAPTDGSARTDGPCEERSLRGSSWHWKAEAQTARMGFGENFVGGIEGFRLALDGEAPALSAATRAFARELARVQASEKKRRDSARPYPDQVQDLQIEQDEALVSLRWAPSAGEEFATYRVYRNRIKGGRFRLIADNLLAPSFKDANVGPGIFEYRVVAVRHNQQGNYSNSVETKPGYQTLPGRMEAEAYTTITGASAATAHDENRHSYGLSGLGGIHADAVMGYWVDITKAGRYQLSYRIAAPRDGKGFELLLNGVKIGAGSVANTGGYYDWQTQSGDAVELPVGRHQLQIKSLDENWKLNWLEFDAMP